MRVPIDLADYILKNKLVAAFEVYAYLNTHYSGKIKLAVAKLGLKDGLGIRDGRTIKKHLDTLHGLNWLGYNERSGYLFIRSIAFVRRLYALNGRKTVSLRKADVGKAREFLASSLLTNKINSMAFARLRQNMAFAVHKRGAANQDAIANAGIGHLGLSKGTIARLLHCSPTRAVQLKHAAEKAGYIATRKHYTLLFEADKGDKKLRANVFLAYPAEKGRLRFQKLSYGKTAVMLQAHDEIIPNLKVRRCNR